MPKSKAVGVVKVSGLSPEDAWIRPGSLWIDTTDGGKINRQELVFATTGQLEALIEYAKVQLAQRKHDAKEANDFYMGGQPNYRRRNKVLAPALAKIRAERAK